MPDALQGARFSEGDQISATCDVCGVETRVPLAGAYHPDIVDQAVSEVTEWLQAHFEAFHPERMGPATSTEEPS